MRKFFKIAGLVLLLLLLLSGGLTLSLRLPGVQNYMAHVAVNYLSKKLGTKVSIDRFEWNLFRNFDLKGFYLADKKGDTIIYAGTLNADISYWSLMNRKINIKAIALEDAKVYLVTDTAGNLNINSVFVRQQSASVIKVKPANDTAAHPINLLVQLQKLSLINTNFKFDDQKKHLLIRVMVPTCNIDVNKIAIEKNLVDIHSLLIDGAITSVTVKTKDEHAPPLPPDIFRFLPPGWQIRWDQISLLNSSFSYDNQNKPLKGKGIDFAHLGLSDINLRARKGAIVRDSIDADIKSLAATEKSGFIIKKLAGLASISVTGISLRNLTLETNHSSLNTYIGFAYNDFEDFNDFVTKVTIKADLNNASISLKDLGYFFQNIGALEHNTITFSGKVRGKLNDLQGKNLMVSMGNNTHLKCNISTHGLPKLSETFLHISIDEFVTSAADIRYISPGSPYPPNFNTLGNIRFTGNFDGFVSDFVTRGNLYTDIGSASSDLNFKYNKQTPKGEYSGELSLNDFDLGKWFGDQATYGKVSLHAGVEGTGIKPETLQAKLVGDITSITLKGYDYRGMKVDGLVKGKFFNGSLSSKDKNFDVDLTGTLDISGREPEYKFTADVRNVNFRELHLTKDTLVIRGAVTADFSGRKADDLVGELLLNNIYILHGHQSATVQNITAASAILLDGQKKITLKSDEIDGVMKGNFSFAELPKALKNYFNYTFTKDYEDTMRVVSQQFTFDLQFFDSSALTQVIDPRFKEIRNTEISGELNTENHILNLSGVIPELIFDKYNIQHFNLDAKSEGGKVNLLASIDRVYAGDSLLVDTFEVKANTDGDEFRLEVKGADAHRYNRADITAYLKPLKSSMELRFQPSEVYLGGNKWAFHPDNRIVVHGKQITTDSLIFSSGAQSIQVQSYLKNDTSTSINVSMSETSLSDFVNIFNTNVRDLKATVNGNVKIEDVFSNPAPTGNIELKDFYLGSIPVGTIRAAGALDNANKKIAIEASVSGEKSNLGIKGFYDLANDEITLNNDITSVNLNFLNYPLFAKYIRHVSGTATAKLNLHGPLKALVLTGALRINDARVNVTYINTTYTLKDEDIEVGDGYFDVGTIAVIDSFNNKAYGTGRLYHEHFKKITLDLHVVADRVQMLNTAAKDLPQFYGTGIVKGNIDFTGTVPLVNINADIQEVRAGTHLYIPIVNTYETNRYSFYRFVNPQKDSLKLRKKEQIKPTGINFILKLQMGTEGVVDVILDPATGDVLTSRGRGELKVEVLRTGEFNIFGNYTIDQGSYLFTMQNIIHKKFELDKGGTINFNGDVYNAQLNADALYRVKTSTYDLISDLLAANGIQPGQDADARARNRINVDLLLKIKGVLQTPEIAFDIKPVDPDPVISSYVDNKMQLMRSNEAELNKQVFGLLVLNRFLPSGTAATADAASGRSLGNSATNTVSEFLSSQLSMYTGSFFDNMNVKDLNVNLNFQTYDQLAATSALASDNFYTRREVQLALTKKFFNQRLSVNVGGNLDFGDNTNTSAGTTSSKNTYATGDFQVEYVLDKNGIWRAKTYNRNDYDNFNNRNINKTGIGISFRREFDNWKDFFKGKAKKPPVQYVPIPAKAEDAPRIQTK